MFRIEYIFTKSEQFEITSIIIILLLGEFSTQTLAGCFPLESECYIICGRIFFIISFFVGYILSFGFVWLRTFRLSA